MQTAPPWKVVKVEEHEGDANQAVLVVNKESVAPIETARGVLNFGFSAIHISREMRALGPAIEDVDLSDTEEAIVTVVEVAAVDAKKTSTN